MQTKFGEMSELQSARTDEGPRPKWMRRMVEDDEMKPEAEEIFKDALWSMAPEWAEGFGAIKGKPVWFSREQYQWTGGVEHHAYLFDVSVNYKMTDITVMLWRTWDDTREQTIDAAVRLERSWMSARQFAEALYDAGMLRASGSEG